MSYDQPPAYNAAPPQQGVPPGYPPQQGGYPPQGYPPQQGGYPPQGYPPQGQPYVAPPTATTTVIAVAPQNHDQDLMMSAIIFIMGWFLICIWLGGFGYIKSPNPTARILGILSVSLYFFYTLFWIIFGIAYGIALANAASTASYYYSSARCYNSYSGYYYYC